MTNLHDVCLIGGSNPRPFEYQANVHPTQLQGLTSLGKPCDVEVEYYREVLIVTIMKVIF